MSGNPCGLRVRVGPGVPAGYPRYSLPIDVIIYYSNLLRLGNLNDDGSTNIDNMYAKLLVYDCSRKGEIEIDEGNYTLEVPKKNSPHITSHIEIVIEIDLEFDASLLSN